MKAYRKGITKPQRQRNASFRGVNANETTKSYIDMGEVKKFVYENTVGKFFAHFLANECAAKNNQPNAEILERLRVLEDEVKRCSQQNFSNFMKEQHAIVSDIV